LVIANGGGGGGGGGGAGHYVRSIVRFFDLFKGDIRTEEGVMGLRGSKKNKEVFRTDGDCNKDIVVVTAAGIARREGRRRQCGGERHTRTHARTHEMYYIYV